MSKYNCLADLNCYHNMPSVRRTVTKQTKNHGRGFYTCCMEAGKQCKFFVWIEDLPEWLQNLPSAPPAPPPSSQTMSSSQPMSSQQPYASQAPSTPVRKRTYGDDDGTPSNNTLSEFSPNKRVKHENTPTLSQGWAPPSPPAARTQGTLGNGEGEELTADAIEQMFSRVHEVPTLVRKLQRKMVAAERSNEIKSKKISELQDEVDRLKARNKELEDVIAYSR